MNSVTLSDMPAQTLSLARRWTVILSRAFSVTFVLVYFFVDPVCSCPGYYLALSTIGLVPLICGPRLYRYLGAAIILCSLLTAEADRRGQLRDHQRVEEIRARVAAEMHAP